MIISRRSIELIIILIRMTSRNSVDSTGTLFFTKYSDPAKLSAPQRQKFRSTFQASKVGDQRKMDEIQEMFNNYNLFKYGQVVTRMRRNSTAEKKAQPYRNLVPEDKTEYVSINKYKNRKQRNKDNQMLMNRLQSMRSERQSLFDKLQEITNKNPRTHIHH